MPWSRIREATKQDRARLELAAAFFIKMHRLETYTGYEAQATDPKYSACFALERALHRWSDLCTTDPERHQQLAVLWRVEAGRALRETGASGIVDGYVVGWVAP